MKPTVYYINFDTQSNPGKLEATTVVLHTETIVDLQKKLNVDLCNHPLYRDLYAYVLANPPR